MEGQNCGPITVQPGATVEHSYCKPERASMLCTGPGSTGPKSFKCESSLTGPTQSTSYAVEGLSFAQNGGDAKCTLVRN